MIVLKQNSRVSTLVIFQPYLLTTPDTLNSGDKQQKVDSNQLKQFKIGKKKIQV